MSNTYRFVISVLVADRVGILRDVSTALAELGANIDGISQTVVAGYFTAILTASFLSEMTAEKVRAAILDRLRSGEGDVVVRPYDPAAASIRPVIGQRFIVTVTGPDRPGLLRILTSFLAEKGINIEDWYVEFEGPNITHIGEVTVPAPLDIKQLQEEFRHLLTDLHLTVCVQHENIFKVTNEVGAIQPLVMRRHHA
ncbi:MAG: ACT domain-containing protein [Kiritimatiellae bacterium]|nr:ACT domain-containing protein [Kiritimatiellia bacterium]